MYKCPPFQCDSQDADREPTQAKQACASTLRDLLGSDCSSACVNDFFFVVLHVLAHVRCVLRVVDIVPVSREVERADIVGIVRIVLVGIEVKGNVALGMEKLVVGELDVGLVEENLVSGDCSLPSRDVGSSDCAGCLCLTGGAGRVVRLDPHDTFQVFLGDDRSLF